MKDTLLTKSPNITLTPLEKRYLKSASFPSNLMLFSAFQNIVDQYLNIEKLIATGGPEEEIREVVETELKEITTAFCDASTKLEMYLGISA